MLHQGLFSIDEQCGASHRGKVCPNGGGFPGLAWTNHQMGVVGSLPVAGFLGDRQTRDEWSGQM